MSQIVSFRAQDDQHSILTQEAAEQGLSVTDYVKQLIEQRHEKTITLAPSDSSMMVARLEGKLEVLQQQNEKLQRELAMTTEKSGLNGVETKNVSIQKQIEAALNTERTANELKGLKTSLKELTEERDELEAEVKELRGIVEENAKIDRWMQNGTQALETIGRIAPKPIERIMNGLAGLIGGGEMAGLPSGISEEDTLALNAGKVLMQNIPQENRMPVINLVEFMAADPKAIIAFYNSKPFKAWLAAKSPSA